MLILDTHVLVWLDQGSDLLGRRARRLIEEAYRDEQLCVASVAFWEVGMLINRSRLSFEGAISEWRVALLNSGIREIPADGSISIAAAGLQDFEGDPIDRLISATAIVQEGKLVTADSRMLSHRAIRTVNGTS